MKNFDELDEELVSLFPKLTPTTDAMYQSFANIVFSYRMRLGLTQQKLADKANVDIKTIHRIEGGSGEVEVADTIYQKVLDALDISWEDVVTYLK